MPHLTLEYTSNIVSADFSELFKSIHELLVITLPTQLENCKSRAIKLDNYYVGAGGESEAFVCCHLRILPGRTDAVFEKVQQALADLLKKYFVNVASNLNLQITVEVSNLSSHYQKIALD